jgi:hypothetical protein
MTVDQLILRFAEIGIAQDQALLYDEYSKFNRLYDHLEDTEKELRRRGGTARLAVVELYSHPNMQVRLNAAIRTLAVAPDAARKMLQWIYDSKSHPQAGDAGMMLSGLDDGSYTPD